MIGHSLIHRCSVQHRSNTAKAYGAAAAYGTATTDVHCRLVIKSQKGFNSITGLFAVATTYTMLFKMNADVLAGDRISAVVDESGTAIAGNFEIEAVLPRRGAMSRHKATVLNKVA